MAINFSEQSRELELTEQRIMESRKDHMEINIPDEGFRRMKEAIAQAKSEKRRQYKMRKRICGTAAAAVFAVICILPNCSRASAQALMNLPVLGRFFEVITIRDYQFDDGHSRADVKVPKVKDSSPDNAGGNVPALEDMNRSVEEYTDEILADFKKNQKELGNEGHMSLDLSYDVVTNTERWFTLEITVTEIEASGYERKHYYHIDKSTGEIATLKDIFTEGSDYQTVISEYIREEMERYNKESEDGEVYWIGKSEFTDGYEGIDDEQNFYLDKQNRIVIVFDEYEVAPGYMGVQKFVIPQSVAADMRRF